MKTILLTLVGFLAVFIVVGHLDSGGILFYQGVALGVVMALAQCLFSRYRLGQPLATSAKDALLSFLLIYAFVFTVPTTLDRSYSVKMIHHLSEARDGLSRDDINRLYVDDFVHSGGVDKRLEEQTATGTIFEKDARYALTTSGRVLAAIFRAMEVTFACGH